MCISWARSRPEAARRPAKRETRAQRAIRTRTHASSSSAPRRELLEDMRLSPRGPYAPENEQQHQEADGAECASRCNAPIPRRPAPNDWRKSAAQRTAPPCEFCQSAGASVQGATAEAEACCAPRDHAAAGSTAVLLLLQRSQSQSALIANCGRGAGHGSAESDSVGVVADSCWRGRSARDRQTPSSSGGLKALRRNVKCDPTRPLQPCVTALTLVDTPRKQDNGTK